MPFQSVPDCAQATVVTTLNGITMNTTLSFAFTGGGYAQEDIDSLAAGVDNWWAAEVQPLLSTSCDYVQTNVRGLEFLSDLEAIDNTNAGPGGNGNEPLPALTAACISFRTGFTGRSARGRNYIPGLCISDMAANENTIDSTVLTSLQTAYELLVASVGGIGWQHVVISRYTLGAARPTGIYRLVTAYVFTDNLWDTQRRRK